MPRSSITSVTFAFLSAVSLFGQSVPSARKMVYIEGFEAAPRTGQAQSSRGMAYDSFIRTFLIVRLQQSKRLQVVNENEPPCASSSGGSGTTVKSDQPNTAKDSSPLHFRVDGDVQQRRDDSGRVFDIVVSYEVFRSENCQSTSMIRETKSFPPENAFGEIRIFTEVIASRLQEEAAEKLFVYLNPPKVEGSKQDLSDAYRRGVRYALADADEYQISLTPNPASAAYTVDAGLQLTPSKKTDGKAQFKISVRSTASGQQIDLPQESFNYQSEADLSRMYFDVGTAIANAVSELQNRRLARIAGDPSEIKEAVVLRRVRTYLCIDKAPGGEKECETRPPLALALLTDLDPSARGQFEPLYLRGEAEFLKHDYADSGKYLDAAISKLPANELLKRIQLLQRSAQAWSGANSYDVAAERYKELVTLRNANRNRLAISEGPQATDYFGLSGAYRHLSKLDLALDAWLGAASLSKDSAALGMELKPILDDIKSPQLASALAKVAKVPGVDLTAAHNRLGQYYATEHRPLEAAQEYKQTYDILIGREPPDEHEICLAANRAGLAYSDASDYGEALRFNKIALEHGNRIWRLTDESISTLTRNIADVYLKIGNAAQAEKVLQDLIDPLRTDPKRSESALIANLYLLTTAIADQRKFSQAQRVYDDIAQRVTKVYGAKSKEYGEYLASIAGVDEEALKYEEARDAHLKAIEIFRVVYSPQDARVGTQLNNLGVVQQFRGDFISAASFYEQGLAIDQKNTSPSPSQLTKLCNIARVYARLGRELKADASIQSGLKVVKPDDHDQANADIWNVRGEMLELRGDYAESARAYQHSLDAYDKVDPRERWHGYSAIEGLAHLDLMRGDFAKADTILRQARESISKRWGESNWRNALMDADLARTALCRKRIAEAKKFLDEAEAITANSLPGNPWLGFASKSVRADIAFAENDLPAAEVLAREVFEDGKRMLTNDSPLTAGARVRVARILLSEGHPKDAADMLDAKSFSSLEISDHNWLLGEVNQVLALVAASDPARADEARSRFAKAQSIYSEWGGAECPRMAQLLRDQAQILANAGQSNESADLIRRAEKIEQKYDRE